MRARMWFVQVWNCSRVMVTGAAPNYSAVFRKSHPAGALVISRGNPGPWTAYDPTKDVGVILHQEVLD